MRERERAGERARGRQRGRAREGERGGKRETDKEGGEGRGRRHDGGGAGGREKNRILKNTVIADVLSGMFELSLGANLQFDFLLGNPPSLYPHTQAFLPNHLTLNTYLALCIVHECFLVDVPSK